MLLPHSMNRRPHNLVTENQADAHIAVTRRSRPTRDFRYTSWQAGALCFTRDFPATHSVCARDIVVVQQGQYYHVRITGDLRIVLDVEGEVVPKCLTMKRLRDGIR